jgi:hypothetical protein
MTGIMSNNDPCPLCGGPMETRFETRTSESDATCNRCGYALFLEIEERAGKLFWVRTEYRAMTHEGKVLGSPALPTWNPQDFAKPDNCDCYACQYPEKCMEVLQ